MDGAFPLGVDFVHLDVAGGATVLRGFEWTPDYLDAYARRFASDGAAGRTVGLSTAEQSWETWERHPAGDELVVPLDGHFELVQETDVGEVRAVLTQGAAAINPAGIWHTLDVIKPGKLLFVTPGAGTEHRPRA